MPVELPRTARGPHAPTGDGAATYSLVIALAVVKTEPSRLVWEWDYPWEWATAKAVSSRLEMEIHPPRPRSINKVAPIRWLVHVNSNPARGLLMNGGGSVRNRPHRANLSIRT